MHRDQQIGLALGILLIGIVAAFFFRNDPDPLREVPQLAAPEILDRQIAERRVAPYITGLEPLPDESSDARYQPPAFPEEPKVPEGPLAAAPNPIGSFADPLASPFESSPVNRNASPAPEPTPPPANAGWAPSRNAAPPQPASPFSTASQTRPQPPSPTLRTHRVQAGDTLSGIALRYLGTSRRYAEVYRVNADLMENPDDLRIGMVLRIPDPPAEDPVARPVSNVIEPSPPAAPVESPKLETATPLPSLRPAPFDDDLFRPHADRPPFVESRPRRAPLQPGDNSGWIPKASSPR